MRQNLAGEMQGTGDKHRIRLDTCEVERAGNRWSDGVGEWWSYDGEDFRQFHGCHGAFTADFWEKN
jgi:hypothetical protein